MEPGLLLNQESAGDFFAFGCEGGFGAAGFVEGGNGFIDFVFADGGGGFHAFGGGGARAEGGLCLEEFADKNLAVGKGFFDNERILGVVGERVGERGGFGGGLGGVEITDRLNGFAELAVGVRHSLMTFEEGDLSEADTEVCFCQTETLGV